MAKKVLIIDDEKDLVNVLKLRFEDKGFEVTCAFDGEEGLEKIRTSPPDVVLVDNVMPRRSGASFVRAVRMDESLKKIPVIMFSGRGEMIFSPKENKFEWQPNRIPKDAHVHVLEEKSTDVLRQAYKVDRYVSKPTDFDVLVDIVREVLEGRRGHSEVDEADSIV